MTGCGRYAFDEREDVAFDAAVKTDALVSMNADGCSDGTREAFGDTAQFHSIAGCAATWPGTPSLRTAPTGSACGNDGSMCPVPADACAAGWHVCATDGDPTDLSSRITGEECLAAGGATAGSFVAASSHCSDCGGSCMLEQHCVYDVVRECLATPAGPCIEPLCCGPSCDVGNLCQLGFFATPTHMGATGYPCGALPASSQTGVLCCQ